MSVEVDEPGFALGLQDAKGSVLLETLKYSKLTPNFQSRISKGRNGYMNIV